MFCSNCGKELPEGSKFCPSCGAPTDASSNKPDIGQTIDNIGENIANEIDQTADEFRQEFKDAGQQFAEARSVVEQRADDFKQNWRDYLTLENMEKVAAIGLFLPLIFTVVLFALSNVLGFLSLIPVIRFVYKLFLFLIKLIFVAASGATLASIGYILINKPEKRTVWSYVTCGVDALAFIACILKAFGKGKPVVILFALVAIVWGIDLVSRVLLQRGGVDDEPRVGDDLNEYKRAWDRYQAANPIDDGKSVPAPVPGAAVSYFDGSGLDMLGLTILTGIVSTITCGIATPWMLCKVYKWRKSHTVIDGRRLDFVGSGSSLLGHWILWCFLSVITCGIFSFFQYVALRKWEMQNTVYADDPNVRGAFDGNSFQFFGYGLLQSLLLMLTCGIAGPWTITMIKKWEVKHETIGNDRMVYDGTALGILGQYLIVLILTSITCGIYSSWGIVRMNKYIYSHTHVNGTK